MSASSVEITDLNFEETVLKSELPVLVDFWAPWCGPCKQLAPVLEEIAVEFAGRLRIGKMDVSSQPVKAGELDIHSIPAMVIFKQGRIVGSLIGAQSKQKITAKLADII